MNIHGKLKLIQVGIVVFFNFIYMKNWFLILFFCFAVGQAQQFEKDPLLVSPEKQLEQIKWVDSVYQGLTLKEKVAQLFMPMIFNKSKSFINMCAVTFSENHRHK